MCDCKDAPRAGLSGQSNYHGRLLANVACDFARGQFLAQEGSATDQLFLFGIPGERIVSTLSAYRIRIAIVLATTLACFQGMASDETSTESPTISPVQTISSANPPAPESAAPAEEDVQAAKRFVLPAKHHAWARFPVGAWREIQTTTETFDEAGVAVSQSITMQVENLQSVSHDRYALNVQATVDLVGKRITGKWSTRVLNSVTDGAGQVVETRRLEDEELTLTNGTVACQVWDVLYRDDARTLVDHVFYSPQRHPHVLRRETTEVASPDSDPSPTEQVVSVVAIEIPYLVEGEILHCTCLQTTRQGDKGSTVRIALVSKLVPGGEVAVWATDFDHQGRRSRWSCQELVGYGLTPLPEPPTSRRELRRARRRSP